MEKKIKSSYEVQKYFEVFDNVKDLYKAMFKDFNKLFNDFLIYDYAEDCFYESWEDLDIMNIKVDIILDPNEKLSKDVESCSLIGYKLVLTEYHSEFESPNNILKERIMKLFNQDFEKSFKKFVGIYVFDGVDYFDKDKNRMDID